MFPAEVANQYYEAQRLYAAGKPAQALAILDDVVRHAPNHPELMHARALCLHATGNLREALKLCNQLYTMHRDRRGLDLRNRWTNPRWGADTAMSPAAEAPAPEPTFGAVPVPAPPAAAPEPVPAPASAPASASAAAQQTPPLDVDFVRNAALLCVGLSAESRPPKAGSEADLPPRLRAQGCSVADYNAALTFHHDVCLPNAARIVDACRATGLPMIFVQFGFTCPDGSDLSPYVYQRFQQEHGTDPAQWPGHPGTPDWLPAEAFHCGPSDRLLHMTGDDAFTSTNLRFIVRNLDLKHLIVLGAPLETRLARTCASARERGFFQLLINDATSAMRESAHTPAIQAIAPTHLANTDDLLTLIDFLPRS